MTYEIIFKPSAEKALSKLPKNIQARVLEKIAILEENPRPNGVVKLEDSDNLYRIRMGDFRIIYSIQDKELLVLVVGIKNRREAYR